MYSALDASLDDMAALSSAAADCSQPFIVCKSRPTQGAMLNEHLRPALLRSCLLGNGTCKASAFGDCRATVPCFGRLPDLAWALHCNGHLHVGGVPRWMAHSERHSPAISRRSRFLRSCAGEPWPFCRARQRVSEGVEASTRPRGAQCVASGSWQRWQFGTCTFGSSGFTQWSTSINGINRSSSHLDGQPS